MIGNTSFTKYDKLNILYIDTYIGKIVNNKTKVSKYLFPLIVSDEHVFYFKYTTFKVSSFHSDLIFKVAERKIPRSRVSKPSLAFRKFPAHLLTRDLNKM